MNPQLYWVFAVWTFLLGLCVGSFLNVVICRLPHDESVQGRSRCPQCGKTILGRDLIPVLSQLLLRSRCRFCGERFSYRYLFIELLTGLMFLGLYLHFTPSRLVEMAVFIVSFSALLAIVVIDWETTLIPPQLWIVILVAGIAYDAYALSTGQREMLRLFPVTTGSGTFDVAVPLSIAGAVVGAVGLRVFVFIMDRVFQKESMGFGDIYLTAAAGAHLGPGLALLLYVVIAAFVGLIVMGIIMSVQKDREDTVIPFGPFLSGALASLMLYGAPITSAVRSFLFPPTGPPAA